MRISGIASGFDTEEMVRQLMQVERMKVDRVEQNKQTILWRQEQYNTINKQFANFILNTQKDMGLKKTSSTGALFGNSYKNVDYVKRATSSNETVATATATSKDVNGSYTFEVEQLATNASFTSAKLTDDILKDSKYLEFKINDDVIKVGNGTKNITMDDVAKAINNATKKDGEKDVSIGVTAFYDTANKRLFIQSTDGRQNINLDSTANTTGGRLIDKLNGEVENKAVYQAGESAKIKYNGVSLEYDSNNITLNGLNIEIKTKGTTTINVNTNVDGIMEKIEKLISDYNDLVDLTSGLVNEKVYSSYKPLSSEERKALSEEDVKLWDEKAKSGLLNRDETLQRTLQSIRTDLYRDVKGLSGSFKNIIEIGITTEKYARGAAGGKLQIDEDKLRKAIEDDAEGVMELLFKEHTSSRPGKPTKPVKDGYDPLANENRTYEQSLAKYETDLRKYEATEKVDKRDNGGIFTRVYDNLIDGMKSIIEKSGPGKDADLYRGVKSNILLDFVTKKSSISDLDKSVNEMNRQIDNLNILLAKKEETHYAKFTAMEKYMYQMNGQSQWIAQQFM